MIYRTNLSYDAGIDRLINGEEYRPFQHLLTKASLMSKRRAAVLFEALKEYAKAYDGHFGAVESGTCPYPCAFTGIQLNEFSVEEHGQSRMITIPELFELDELSTAPPEYLEMMNLVCVVGGRSLGPEPAPKLGPPAVVGFARELFRLIYCAHHCCDSVLSYGFGTCLVEDYVTAAGWCTDFYFLTSVKGKSRPAIFSARCRDLVEGFSLIVRQADSPEAITAGLTQALEDYPLGKQTPGNRVSPWIQEIAEARIPARRNILTQFAERLLSNEGDR